jgi:hypothetical protein
MRARVWDTIVCFVERRQRWWWNAYRSSTGTELHGFADSPEQARQAMYRAIEQAERRPPPHRPPPLTRHPRP